MITYPETLRESRSSQNRPLSRLLTTKLAVPSLRANLVARRRLTDRLYLSPDQRLLLVAAPAGWGKTSLLCDWVVQQSESLRGIAWVSLDAGDNDPTRFLLYLTAAFGRAYPGLGEAAHRLLLTPQPVPPDLILTVLLNEISALNRSLAIVLDDYHLIEAPAVHKAVTFLLDHLPPSLHVIIATRSDPPLPLSRMRARGQLLEIRTDDLRFTREEAAAFLNQAMGLNLDAETTARLETRTEGWIAALQLAALSVKGQENPSQYIASFTGSHRYIADYLFDEVLAFQPEETRKFLIETSILERLCGPLCEAVLEQAGGQALLETLEARSLFVIPLDAERRWYRYHHLFAEALRERLTRQGQAQTAELHGRASAWYERAGMMEEAVFHALEGKHWAEAARLIEQSSDAIWMQGGLRTQEKWLKALPPEWIPPRPILSFMRAALYLYDLRIPEAASTLENCLRAAREDSWTQDIRGRVAALRSHIQRFNGDFDSAVSFAREALASLSKDSPLWRGSALFSLGVALFEGDQLPAAAQSLQESIAESRKIGDTHTFVLAAIAYGQLLYAQGALAEAARIYQSALTYAEERRYHYAGEIIVLYAGLGRLHYQWNDLAAAEAHSNEGLMREHPVYPVSCHLQLLRVRQARNDQEGVSAVMRTLEDSAQQASFSWLPAAVIALKIRLKLLDEDAAEVWARSYETREPGQWPPRTPHDLREIEDLTWAHLRLGEGQAERVRARMESLLTVLTRQGRHGSAMSYRALLATLYRRQSQMDQAVAVLEPALALAAKENYIRVFLEAGPALLPVLQESMARGLETETVARLLDAFRSESLLPPENPAGASPLAEPLSKREIEVLRLIAAGLSNPEIAEHLFVSVGTIKRHAHNIFGKLDVANRVNALARARELNLL